MYIRIWRFRPHPQRVSAFKAAYGPDGVCVKLFKLGTGFLGTELLQCDEDSTLYFTIDRWADKRSWETFKSSHGQAYAELDDRCASLTIAEGAVGFEERDAPAS